MKGTQHTGLPSDYITASDALKVLGVSRRTAYKNGYLDALDSWQLVKSMSHRLYKRGEVYQLKQWLDHCKATGTDWKAPATIAEAMEWMDEWEVKQEMDAWLSDQD